MFRFQQLCLVIVAGFILFLSAACDPALCGDTLIPIDFDDVTKPELYWEVDLLKILTLARLVQLLFWMKRPILSG